MIRFCIFLVGLVLVAGGLGVIHVVPKPITQELEWYELYAAAIGLCIVHTQVLLGALLSFVSFWLDD